MARTRKRKSNRPLNGDLSNVMRPYAERGIREWSSECSELKERAMACVRWHIADSKPVMDECLNGRQPVFIPMPQGVGVESGDFDRAFFLPEVESGRLKLLMVLLQLARTSKPEPQDRAIGFRFEPAEGHRQQELSPPEESHTRHAYPHVQLTRRFRPSAGTKRSLAGAPCWLPERYPAVPLPSDTPLDLFLVMVVAAHGYPARTQDLLAEILQESAAVYNLRWYRSRLAMLLRRATDDTNPA